jgi:hypothetical protein
VSRRIPFILLILLVCVGFLSQSVAFGQAEAVSQLPLPDGGFVVNVGDLTFPGAVFLGAWMLARALPGALRTWTPTLRIELVHAAPKTPES